LEQTRPGQARPVGDEGGLRVAAPIVQERRKVRGGVLPLSVPSRTEEMVPRRQGRREVWGEIP